MRLGEGVQGEGGEEARDTNSTLPRTSRGETRVRLRTPLSPPQVRLKVAVRLLLACSEADIVDGRRCPQRQGVRGPARLSPQSLLSPGSRPPVHRHARVKPWQGRGKGRVRTQLRSEDRRGSYHLLVQWIARAVAADEVDNPRVQSVMDSFPFCPAQTADDCLEHAESTEGDNVIELQRQLTKYHKRMWYDCLRMQMATTVMSGSYHQGVQYELTGPTSTVGVRHPQCHACHSLPRPRTPRSPPTRGSGDHTRRSLPDLRAGARSIAIRATTAAKTAAPTGDRPAG